MKYWPEGTPEECKINPSFCPGIQPKIISRCWSAGNPLDFIHETRYQGYNFKKFSTDDLIVQKVQTGKGDETSRFNSLGKILYIEMMFGNTQPRKIQ